MDTTHPSCQWILTLISSRPARHALVLAVAAPQGPKAMSKHIFPHTAALPAQLRAVLWRAGLFQTCSSQSYSVSLKTPSHCF